MVLIGNLQESGKIVKTGDSSLASHINEGGFKSIASFV
jgi:Fe-S cluster assembly ATPase SufC